MFSGELQSGLLAFMPVVKLAEAYDWDTVVVRLTDIRAQRGIPFEVRPSSRTIAVPPSYRVSYVSDPFAGPAPQEGGTP